VVLTREPEERLVRKLSRAVCALLTSPELSAEPICESRLANEVLLELPDVLLAEEESDVSSKLVSES
jgi:hypothetical protein